MTNESLLEPPAAPACQTVPPTVASIFPTGLDAAGPPAGFPKLKKNQLAGQGNGVWQVFDSLEAAGAYAKKWVAVHRASQYKIYDAQPRLLKTVMNGQPFGDLHAAWQARQPAAWWKFWK